MNLTASGIPLSMIRAMNLTNTALYRTKFRMGLPGLGFGLCGHDCMSLIGVETTSSRAYESLYYTIRVDCEQQSRG